MSQLWPGANGGPPEDGPVFSVPSWCGRAWGQEGLVTLEMAVACEGLY